MAICLAATIGWNIGAWIVPNTVSALVWASKPAAQVIVSKEIPWKSDLPP